MATINLFEAKAHLSALVRSVAETGQDYVVTVRGKPMVRIVPIEKQPESRDVWELRERVVEEYGVPDFVAPDRTVEPPRDPLSE
ncbi:MAG: type II toxin-antitoxin system prevent-host-death family antitoxin [Spirochaetales bacterium]|nr:type II toxin-antitoxin system prevent-host-death family antitoxin [Spirochaetales bacterium]